MAEPDRRERKKQRTRASIQDAAIELFAERGYQDTTIAAIADAADVAARTVTGHFPTKQDLVFADDPFTAASLEERFAAGSGSPALEVFRDWLATTMRALTGERSREYWRFRSLRSRLILENPDLRARSRGTYFELEVVLARAVGAERDEESDALVPRLVAATVVSGIREVYASYDARPAAQTPSPEDLLAMVDRVLAFARAGARGLDDQSSPLP